MMICLNVSNIQQSENFFIQELGMTRLPFPLARIVTSQYEPKQPRGSAHLGFGQIGLSLLLQEAPKGVVINPGNLLNSFSVIFDDSSRTMNVDSPANSRDYSKSTYETIEDRCNQILIKKSDVSLRSVISPDGYKFILTPYSEYI
jgi:hypothetical protein